MRLSGVDYSCGKNVNFQRKKDKKEPQYEYDFFVGRYCEKESKRKKSIFDILSNPIKDAQLRAQIMMRQANEDATAIYEQAQRNAYRITREAEDKARGLLREKEQEAITRAKETTKEEIAEIERRKKSEIQYLEHYYTQQHEQKMATLKAQEDELQANIDSTQKLFDRLRRHDIEGEIQETKEELRKKIDSYELDYNYNNGLQLTTHPQGASSRVQENEELINLRNYSVQKIEKTQEKALQIPEFLEGETWEYQVPQVGEITLPEYKRMEFSEAEGRETSISMSYADSVFWSVDKISRDLLQNFFDGHGQTLDGVKFAITPTQDGKYKVKIEGQAQYTQEKAILLGESTKRNNNKAAGNFGEGLKVVVLKLLKEYGADEVNIASDNWRVCYQAKESEMCKKDVLSYSLLKEEPIEGNYIEFETDNLALINSLRTSINNFYHSNNPDFQNLIFENEVFGLKELGENESGSIYISGQKFEYGSSYDYRGMWQNVPGYTIIFKEKPSITCDIDISRDRLRLDHSDVQKMIKACMYSPKTSEKDICELLLTLKDYWEKDETTSYYSSPYHKKSLASKFLNGIIDGAASKGMKIDFPSCYLASCGQVNNGYDYYYEKNHIICKPEFRKLGMQTTSAKAFSDRGKVLITPDEKQIKKIGIIKETIKCLERSILSASTKFNRDDLNPNIYIFDETGPFAGEHRQDGFWISNSELNSSFNRVISTALHEICHKEGPDGSMEFTYVLTDMLNAILNAALKDKETLIKLKALKSLWDEINYGEYQF